MTRTPYQIKKAREARQSDAKKIERKAKEKVRRQLSRVTRPLKAGRPLSDHVCLSVTGLTTALFTAWVQSQWQEGWNWSNYGCTSQGGLWNLDHIRALAHWNVLDPSEAKKANHWTNLAPSCARLNDHKRENFSDFDRWQYGTNLYAAKVSIPEESLSRENDGVPDPLPRLPVLDRRVPRFPRTADPQDHPRNR